MPCLADWTWSSQEDNPACRVESSPNYGTCTVKKDGRRRKDRRIQLVSWIWTEFSSWAEFQFSPWAEFRTEFSPWAEFDSVRELNLIQAWIHSLFGRCYLGLCDVIYAGAKPLQKLTIEHTRIGAYDLQTPSSIPSPCCSPLRTAKPPGE